MRKIGRKFLCVHSDSRKFASMYVTLFPYWIKIFMHVWLCLLFRMWAHGTYITYISALVTFPQQLQQLFAFWRLVISWNTRTEQ